MIALSCVAAVAPALQALPTDPYATVYIGKHDRGTGPFIRRKFRVPGPIYYRGNSVHQVGIIDVMIDIRESENTTKIRDEFDPVMKAISNYYWKEHRFAI